MVLRCPWDALVYAEGEVLSTAKQNNANAATDHLLGHTSATQYTNHKPAVSTRGLLQTVTHWIQAD